MPLLSQVLFNLPFKEGSSAFLSISLNFMVLLDHQNFWIVNQLKGKVASDR
jgi:hypothetical protein